MRPLRLLSISLTILVHGRRISEKERNTEQQKSIKATESNYFQQRQVLSSQEKVLALLFLSHGVSSQLSRRATLASSLALLSPLGVRAGDAPAVGTYSLKGIPGLGSLTGADAPRPEDRLGVIGRGVNKDKSGRLNDCSGKGCISSFESSEDLYVPPWTYRAKDVNKTMTLEEAFADLRAVVEAAGGNVVKAEGRYLYAEFQDSLTGSIDDVEFLLSKDKPLVGYKSSPRRGKDDKRQRNRIKELRKALQERSSDWKSIGRIPQEDY